MFTFFNSESLWIGTDMNKLSQIRSILDNNAIKYKYKVKNHLGQWNDRGTTRGTMGSLGNSTDQMYQYEIFVHKKEYEKAKYLINKEHSCNSVNTPIE